MTYNHEEPARSIDQGNRLDDAAIREIVEYYEAELASRMTGPQLEGVEGAKLEEALKEQPENIVLIEVPGKQGEVIKWPVLLPIKYHQDYSPEFVQSHHPDDDVYFFSLPAHDGIEDLMANPDALRTAGEFLTQRQAVVAYDYQKGDDAEGLIPAFLEKILENSNARLEDVTPESEAWGMQYGLPRVVFYEGEARSVNPVDNSEMTVRMAVNHIIAERGIEVLPENGVTFLSADQLHENNGELLERLWEMYNAQFNMLVEDHPALFQQPKEEFESMLLDGDTLNVAYMHEGQPVGLLYLVSNIKKCVWLNPKYYEDKYDDDRWVAFFPGVVVAADMAQKDMGFVQEMMNAVAKVAETSGKDLTIACACSNVSMTYIIKMIERFVESNYKDSERQQKYPQRFQFVRDNDDDPGMKQTAEYIYRIMRVIPAEG